MALDAALSLLKCMPVSKLGESLTGVCKLQPDLIEDLLEEVDQPLKLKTCNCCGNEYIICDHNRDGDSFRSPWNNKYQPENEEGILPSGRLRTMEVALNSLFKSYAHSYYDLAVTSVYLWDLDTGFAGAVLIKKDVTNMEGIEQGGWDSIHVLEAEEDDANTFTYTLTTTIMLHLKGENAGTKLRMSGSLTTQNETEERVTNDEEHIRHIGELVQNTENKIRNTIDQVYFGKAMEVTGEVRSKASLKALAAQAGMAEALAARFAQMNKN
eukprot:TRINITY_DN453_c2_g2_i1.p1 TRINITY_DN453_c2_g2~~TRINITY_DN453_c2_g2_i1.p1  ORF type:complete len:286 (+),score=77.84 TRINITY_DN453_c2_g2_i1:54-860(+)